LASPPPMANLKEVQHVDRKHKEPTFSGREFRPKRQHPIKPAGSPLERRFKGTAVDWAHPDNASHAVSALRCFWKVCGTSSSCGRVCAARHPDHTERQHWRPLAGLYGTLCDSAHNSIG